MAPYGDEKSARSSPFAYWVGHFSRNLRVTYNDAAGP